MFARDEVHCSVLINIAELRFEESKIAIAYRDKPRIIRKEYKAIAQVNKVIHKEDKVLPKEERTIRKEKKIIPKEHKVIPKEEKVIRKERKIPPTEKKVMHVQDKVLPKEERTMPKEKKIIPKEHKVIPEKDKASLPRISAQTDPDNKYGYKRYSKNLDKAEKDRTKAEARFKETEKKYLEAKEAIGELN